MNKKLLCETEEAITEPEWVCTRPSAYKLLLLVGFLWGVADSGGEGYITLLPALGTHFSCWMTSPSIDVRVCA